MKTKNKFRNKTAGKSFLLLLMFMVGFLNIKAQTVNTGELYVSQNTVFSTLADFDNNPTGNFYNDGEAYIYADFRNDGTVDFLQNTGLTRFQGKVTQEIEGNRPSYFYDVLFNNNASQPAFELSGEISVSGNANFFNGIVKNDDFGGIMIFEKEATHSNTYDHSHVDGEVYKNGESGWIFPIGDDGYFRDARISAPNEKASSFQSKYFHENSNSIYPHNRRPGNIELINNAEYWTLEKIGGKADVLLTLTWNPATTPSEIYASPNHVIHIVRWDKEKQLWIDEGGAVDVTNRTVTTFTEVSGYGVFTLARVKDAGNFPEDNISFFNGISNNEDSKNNYFRIEGIENYPNNTLKIFNRWGVVVYETQGYGQSDNVFRGISGGRATVQKEKKLPTGTYFYILIIVKDNGEVLKKTGYLYIESGR